jgi:hypothetical protein
MRYVNFDTQENGNILLRTGVILVDTVRPQASMIGNKRAGGQ